ncbi:transposase [Alphaproteobacteria bacterium]
MLNPKVAEEFFELHLPITYIRESRFKYTNIAKRKLSRQYLRQRLVDMLSPVQFGQNPGYFYLVVEQQTKPDYWMSFRLYKYMLRICDMHLKKHQKDKHLPLVCPIVFYTGLEKYNAPVDLWSLFTDAKLAKSFFVEPFQLIELQKIEDQELKKHVWAGIMEFVMKRIFEKDIFPFLQSIEALLAEISKQDLGYLEAILCYTLEQAESEKGEEVVNLFKQVVSEENRGSIMSIADRLREQAKQEGIQTGMQQGKFEGKREIALKMLSERVNLSLISKVTGISESELKGLENKLIQY